MYQSAIINHQSSVQNSILSNMMEAVNERKGEACRIANRKEKEIIGHLIKFQNLKKAKILQKITAIEDELNQRGINIQIVCKAVYIVMLFSCWSVVCKTHGKQIGKEYEIHQNGKL